jgi:thioredoxin reductase/pSer/pThr/pTyr-binding forkhead associated (FHA) protein/ferredoxin
VIQSRAPADSGDGRVVADTQILDVLVIGGGPAGTAAAFRAKELGLRALVIDFDDLLKRIRDYSKDKLILPDFGGGDRMAFPVGGDCIAALQFAPIDKDDMCARWKGLYSSFEVPVRTGIELSSVERTGETWSVMTWDHGERVPVSFQARHVVLALGRGVPRRFDVPGNTDGIAYRLDDPAHYVDGPVLVVGGGTSAAEAVLAISRTKIAADERSAVYWSYRGTKMPRVSKALAEQFFEAYIGNGNIRHFAESEPVAIVTDTDRRELVSLRVDRKTPDHRPPETVHLEFRKSHTIACIGEDIPESLLLSMGIAMVPGGAPGKKSMAVTPLLETTQPNIYLIGDLLSPSYLETDTFVASPETCRQVKHRGNIKSSLRDGVFIAEVIKQRLEGRSKVVVVIEDAKPLTLPNGDQRVTTLVGLGGVPSAELPTDPRLREGAYLVAMTPAGIEAGEFRLKTQGTTTLGRVNADIVFAQDTLLADSHASISFRDGKYVLRDDGSQSGTYLGVRPGTNVTVRDGDLLRAGRQILLVAHATRDQPPRLDHFDGTGRRVGSYRLRGTIVFGRSADQSGVRSRADVILDDRDQTLSRFHLSVTVEGETLQVQDFGSTNGTYLRVNAERPLEHGDVFRIGGQQLRFRLDDDMAQKRDSEPAPEPKRNEAPAALPPPPPTRPLAPVVGSAVAARPHVTFMPQNIAGDIDDSKSLLDWADAHDVSIDFECNIGMCGCDPIRIISGGHHLNSVTENEVKTLRRRGLEPGPCRLACMTRTGGPVVVEVISDS